MFKDLPEGQTHYENDGCGMKEHNPMKPKEKRIEKLNSVSDVDFLHKINEIIDFIVHNKK